MKAMNGSAVSLRRRGRLIGSCMALVLALAALLFGSAALRRPKHRQRRTYLALGDSISFGYSAEKFGLHEPDDSPSYFEEGFTNDFTNDLKKPTEVGKTIRLVNDGCPGETSNGLIGENESLGGESIDRRPRASPGPGRFPSVRVSLSWTACRCTTASGCFEGLKMRCSPSCPKRSEAISLQIGSNNELARRRMQKRNHP